jgi:crotonobetainyl-CoA:carnitine CoA-transferase CaiB-like acyl-CoA transferase
MDQATNLLGGYTALDFTDLKGQLCGRLLADLGMNVIKVEPTGGDPVRNHGPSRALDNQSSLSLTFAHLNANKKSVIIDLTDQHFRSALLGLVKNTDVLLESFSPGFLASIGLGYETFANVNPRLVMCSITGFGQNGPNADLAYTDIVIHAMSGLHYIAGDPALPPCKPPETQAYYFGSLFAALGAVAALYRRELSGRGDHVDVSMQETLATQESTIRMYANDGQILRREGSRHSYVAPAEMFPCKDGYVFLYVSRRDWKEFLKIWTDHPAELEGAEWMDNGFRRAHAERFTDGVAEFTSRYKKDELTTFLQSRGINCLPVNGPREFINDRQIQERAFFVKVQHSDGESLDYMSSPFIINGRRPEVRRAPLPGEHQEQVIDSVVAHHTFTEGPAIPHLFPDNELPLSGMRVLSFDHVLAGPYGMTLLAELGAEVIKVESRNGGLDPMRYFGLTQDPNLSSRFLEFNRNKLSITINLKHPDGPSIIKELTRHCDAVMDNFSVRVMPNCGLDYADLRQSKPDIVVLRMPGLGCTGPNRHYATVGTNITAYTGFTYLWNHPGHVDPPVGSQCVYPDFVSGLLSAVLITAGVLNRRRTGRGAFIDLSQAEAAAYMIGPSLMASVLSDEDLEPLGNASPADAPQACYPCRGNDRWCVISIETEAQWHALAQCLGRADWLRDPRFSSPGSRREHREVLDKEILGWTQDKDPFYVMDLLQRAGVPCGVVQTGKDLVADPHLKQRGFLVEHDNPRLGHIMLPGFPLKFASRILKPDWRFPELGRDNTVVFGNLLGYTHERIAQLVRDHVLE